jgi:gliding motility-associated lipoprotein GldB
MRMNRILFLMAIVIFLVTGCNQNPLKVDLSGVKVEIKIERLDQDLFTVTKENEKTTLPELQAKYGEFFTAYNQNVIALGNPNDPLYPDYLQTFLNDSMIVAAKAKCDSVFTDISPIEKRLQKAFSYYKYYFPGKRIPKVFTYISGFNQAVIMMPDALGISLDNYLGSDYRLYTQLALDKYKRENMFPEKIPFDAMFAWSFSEFEMDATQENLLSNMIYYGKLLYLLDAFFPDDPDYLKIGYKAEKLKWCEEHEEAMWTYLVENKQLYSNDRMTIVRFINPAPFTSTFTDESPGRTGVWIGWQIVRKFMKNHPEITASALMQENDCQKILNESRYAPH